jgi:hypothetical protein
VKSFKTLPVRAIQAEMDEIDRELSYYESRRLVQPLHLLEAWLTLEQALVERQGAAA